MFLLSTLAAYLAAVSLVQLVTRQLIELPELYAQERSNDLIAVQHLREVLGTEVTHKRELVEDGAHWTDAYEFVEMDVADPGFAQFIAREFTYVETMHVVPRINGYLYFAIDGELVYESSHDLLTEDEGEPLELPLTAFPLPPEDDYTATRGGFLASRSGPALYAITGITNDERDIKPNGYLVVWRKMDKQFFDEVLGPFGVEFSVLEAAGNMALVSSIRNTPDGVLFRDEKNYLSWLIDDTASGEPLFVVRQLASPRLFNDGLLSAASAVGITASALALAFFAFILSRRVISPILQISGFMEAVADTEDFSRRLPITRDDELGTVGSQLNELLERVESQDAALKSKNATLELLAERDPLTSLRNRRAFDRALRDDWARAKRADGQISCIMIDVDYFKDYNDNYGHQAGDKVLQMVAGVLERSVLRATDSVSRYGGEEFIILLPNTSNSDAAELANRVVKSVNDQAIMHEHSECAAVVTVSAGVATGQPAKAATPESFVKAADEALYCAKKVGRNRALNGGVVTL